MFVVKNRDLFKLNSDIHKTSTRYNNDCHLPSAQSKWFQKGAFYSGIQKYNHFPLTTKELSYDVKRFRRALKRFIQLSSFLSLEEYFDSKWKWVMLCLFVNHISIFVKWYAELNTSDFVSLYFKCIASYYCILFFYWPNFLFNLVYILLYICCVSFIVINMTISISCKKIYGKINDMNMNKVSILELCIIAGKYYPTTK